MTLSRPLLLAVMLVGVLLHSFGFVVAALAADVPKDEAAFTVYIQAKLQLYSPSPINLVRPLSLSVGTTNAAVKLPSLKSLHKLCVVSPPKCDHAVNDYVQNAAREFLQKPAAAPPASPVAPIKPTIELWRGPQYVFEEPIGTTKMRTVVVSFIIHVQDLAGEFATDQHGCILLAGPIVNLGDSCMPPIMDLLRSPRFVMSDEPTRSLELDTVIVGLTIHADGSVSDVAVLRSSGSSWLDGMAVKQAKGRHYFPATKAGTPVDVPIKSAIQFKF